MEMRRDSFSGGSCSVSAVTEVIRPWAMVTVAGEDYAVEEAKINPHFPVGKVAIYPNHIP
ncbi:MAG: hypothetical protein V8K32_14330 [Candidatus Electrothrix gigas]